MQVYIFAVSQIVDSMLIFIYSLVWVKIVTFQLNDINSDNCWILVAGLHGACRDVASFLVIFFS